MLGPGLPMLLCQRIALSSPPQEHKNDFFTQIGMQSKCLNYDPTMVDLWSNGAPAHGLNGTQYEEYMFRDRVMSIIDDWDQQKPLFLVFTPHVAHCPLQVPEDVWEKFDFEDDEGQCKAQTPYIFPGTKGADPASYRCRSQYHGMISILDDHFAAIESKLKGLNVWDETLIVSSSDVSTTTMVFSLHLCAKILALKLR